MFSIKKIALLVKDYFELCVTVTKCPTGSLNVHVSCHHIPISSLSSITGDMTGLEFYSSRLTPEEVWRAYKEGPCSPRYFSSSFLENRILGWSDITKLPRPDTVKETFINSENFRLYEIFNLSSSLTLQLIRELKEDIHDE